MPACPDGHDSATTDFCDVCGRPMTPVASTVDVSESAEPCPVCGEPKTGRFCEGCSYDFVSGARKTQPVTPGTWTALVTADRAYYDAVDLGDEPIPFPQYCPQRSFPLTGSQIRIGRRSRSRGVTPEIDLTGPPEDTGVSHLHALLVSTSDGWSVVDPGSTNGTTINDGTEPIAVDRPVPLADGDRIHVGAWTTITLTAPRRD